MQYDNYLYEYRKKEQVSQDDLADAIGSCRKTISNIERGTQDPSLSMAYRIAAYFRATVYDVFPDTHQSQEEKL